MILRPELLTHPNIPKPLHGLNPRTLLGKEWWDMTRQATYAKQGYRCAACGVHKSEAKFHHWLEAHEIYKIDYKKGCAEMVEIVALCHACHNFIHSGRLSVLRMKGEISSTKYHQIMDHGERLLMEADLAAWDPTIGEEVQQDWSSWHLILEGKKYYSRFKSYEDWFNAYN